MKGGASSRAEWLEARGPAPALLPADPDDAAIVRSMASLIGCDIHEMNNLHILNTLYDDFAGFPEDAQTLAVHWISDGFAALETFIMQHGGVYALAIIRRWRTAISFPKSTARDALASTCRLVRALSPPRRQPDADL